jgi:hypothetical protein
MRCDLRVVVLLCVLGKAAAAGDRSDWQSIGQLQAGDRIRVSRKTGPVDGSFQSWTTETVTTGAVTTKREDVLKIERYRPGGSGRAKSAGIGALIGFGGGFAIGASAGGCPDRGIGPCFPRGTTGAVVGVVGAVAGAGVGALFPRHHKELIYSIK